MKPSLKLLLTLLLFTLISKGQTKKSFHKSHSGNGGTFNKAINNNLFGTCTSNFGMAPDLSVFEARLDSLIALNDTTVIMVTSRCQNKSGKKQESKKWKPGREIVYHHPDFYKKNSVEKIKSVLKKNYHFVNSPDSVKFIGFAKSAIKNNPPENSLKNQGLKKNNR